ncbi:hypothetical protein [bacterium endosymbiont of Bathymodiolus sp. 5 South]|jgi:predicted DNA binding CopG/RHH family protein|uniref:hypothetical protein n=1 Tax=bacterium endosymbiont of Bathymodiolus sp. 5 South TaxID=1181670 RepID=UPI0010B0C4BF|nr:hypothetical protein [bacterium endosymbiont of Bathymodiolus sp. 5 South]SSC08684.1 hypothetical protein BTURTLESOX_1770 [bacterium endosymbiont of Bathymodiolus sp. 5 South]
MSKNNLDHLIIKKTSVLPKPKSKVGRPTTNPNEKESETIALKITPLELAAVKEKAGVAGLSTYIKHYIRTNTELFK